MRDVVVIDASMLAAPWASDDQWMAEIGELKGDHVLPVVLATSSVRLPRRRAEGESFTQYAGAVGWRAWMRLLPLIRAQDSNGMLDERLQHVGNWLEEHVLGSGAPVRVVVVSIEAPDELLEVVTWCADQRSASQPVGVRHLLWEMGKPVIGLAVEVRRHLDLAGDDVRAMGEYR